MQIYRELVDFLKSDNIQVRGQAVQCVSSLSTTADAVHYFSDINSGCIASLQSLCLDDSSPMIAHDAFKALINLSGSSKVALELAGSNGGKFMIRLVQMIINPKFLLADLGCMLMSNVTKFMAASNASFDDKYSFIIEQLISRNYLPCLVDAFCQGRSHNSKADFHFLASSEHCRKFFMDESRNYPVKSLTIFTENENIIRRGGVISTIKTLCMSTDFHQDLIAEDKANILPAMLLPLAGPEEFSDEDMEGMPDELQLLPDTKTRESDKFLRKQLLDTLLALCTTRKAREIMRTRKVYPIIRELHLNETDPECELTIQEIVQLLCRDEEDSSTVQSVPVPKLYEIEEEIPEIESLL